MHPFMAFTEVFLWSIFLLFLLHVILYLQHFFWRSASKNCLFAKNVMFTFFFFFLIQVASSLGKSSLLLTVFFLKMHLFGKPGLDALTSGSVQGREGKWNQPGCSIPLPSLQNRAPRQPLFAGMWVPLAPLTKIIVLQTSSYESNTL